jgi:acetolactate synthase-1/2/3 large subunit
MLAPIAGAMGFGVPAAVAASLRHPGRQVICLVGDGGLLMTGSELAVALERGLPLKVIVSENGMYGSIRIHQEREYPGRPSGTSFTNPDLELLGRAYGFPVTAVRERADIAKLSAVLASAGPAFVVVRSSVQAVLPQAQGASVR